MIKKSENQVAPERRKEIIELIRKEVKPALGCTEPIAVALAVAKSAETLCAAEASCNECRKEILGLEGTDSPKNSRENGTECKIKVAVSGNILKNGMGVGIPGTGMVGLHIAAALGAVCGKSEYGLEVLKDLTGEAIEEAKRLTEEGRVEILLAQTEKKLYVEASVISGNHTATTKIEDDHDHITEVSLDGIVQHLADKESGNAGKGDAEEKSTLDYHLTVKEIYDFATTAPYGEISFILESRKLNLALAEDGLRHSYGLKVGRTILDAKLKPIFGDDFLSYAMAMTAAASDARMAGCTLPAMSNSGSGNQGITVTMPVIAYSLKNDIDDENLARALTLSHLIAIHIKGYLGKLSALCGCVIASTGSSCGLVLLNGGGYEEICSAIKNMIGNITGMVCDGAKVGCAMKVASGVSSSIQSAVLALNGISATEHDGIIDKDIEKTIRNMGRIGSVGMQRADNMILDIMVCK